MKTNLLLAQGPRMPSFSCFCTHGFGQQLFESGLWLQVLGFGIAIWVAGRDCTEFLKPQIPGSFCLHVSHRHLQQRQEGSTKVMRLRRWSREFHEFSEELRVCSYSYQQQTSSSKEARVPWMTLFVAHGVCRKALYCQKPWIPPKS